MQASRSSSDDESLRTRQRVRTREAIVAAGVRLFVERGFDETTVADIAAEAEVSPATVFRYFGTKEALLFANHEAEQQQLCDAVRRHGHLPDRRAVMAAAVLDVAGEMRPDDEQYVARIRVIAGSPVLLGAALRTRAAWEAAAAEQLAQASSREPDLSDRVAAGAAVGALHAAVREWYGGGRPVSECLREALAALWPDLPGDVDRTAGPRPG